jgi:hypothetical protein
VSHLQIAALVVAGFVFLGALGAVGGTMRSSRRRPSVCLLCDHGDLTALCECLDGCGSAFCWRYS